ncbi:MAG: hypothetical protein R2839_07200 [Thermomicrobiales bacterium]
MSAGQNQNNAYGLEHRLGLGPERAVLFPNAHQMMEELSLGLAV